MEFKKLSDVEVVAEPTETANVLIEENGVIKKAPKTAVGGGAGGNFVVISIPYVQEMDVDSTDIIEGATCNKTFDEVLEMYCSGEIDLAVLRMVSEQEGYGFNVCNAIGLFNADGPVTLSNASLAECIAFAFGDSAPICYYRNGLSYSFPISGPV
jgi:hypothetical protein